jgi:hypothetical protein
VSKVPNHITAVLRALRFQGSDPEALTNLTEQEWTKLLSCWDILCLMIPLRRTCGDVLPEGVRVHIDRNIEKNADRFKRIQTIYGEIAGALRHANVEHIVLKGFAQWPDYCEHPRFRFQGDIDLYCPRENITAASQALRSLDYNAVREFDWRADHIPPLMRPTDWRSRGDLFDPEMPVAVEVHFCLWNKENACFEADGVKAFWSRRLQTDINGFSFPSLNPEDKLGHSALHVLRDLLQGSWVTSKVYELGRFLHLNADNQGFWKRWRDSHPPSLRSLESISFRLAKEWFDCRLSEEVAWQIRTLPDFVERWICELGDAPLRLLSSGPNKDCLWLHLSLLHSISAKRKVLHRTLVPTKLPSSDSVSSIDRHQVFIRLLGPRFEKDFRYFSYVCSRVLHHARLIFPTVWAGVRLWWSPRKKLAGNFTGNSEPALALSATDQDASC